MTRLSLVACVLLLNVQAASADVVIPGKLDPFSDQLLIPVLIGSHTFWCGPDSGFSALIALDQAKAVAAGLRVGPGEPTPDGNPPSRGDSGTRATVVIGGVTFTNHPIIVRRFPEQVPEMDCVFGVALLRQFIVEFDYVMPRLTLRDRATYRPPAGTEAIPLLFRANPRVPYVDIRITLRDGSELPLRVLPDTGTSFYGAVLVGGARARVQSQLPYTPAISYPDPQQGRIVQISAGRPQSIAIGSFTMNQPVIAFVQGTLGNGIADGTIGCGFFKRFVVGFDFDGRVMYLRPNAPFSPRQEFDASGIGFIRRGGRHVVFKVIADSVAAAAEVHVGDVLSEIDGRPAAELTASQLRGLLSVDGATRRLLLQREGRSVEIRLRLKTRI